MSSAAIAERYAQAVFELSEENDQLAAVCDGLDSFSQALHESETLRSTLTDPLLPVEQKEGLLRDLAKRLGVNEIVQNTLLVMARRGRLSAVTDLATRLSDRRDQKEGVLRAQVVTATAMPEAFYDDFSTKLQQATGRKVVLERAIDADIVGGAVAHVGDTVLDASVRGRLRQLEQSITAALSTSGAK